MKSFILICMIVLLSGCTTYSVEKQSPSQGYTKVTVKSTRSFEQPDLSYTRTGSDATLNFSAASADNNTDVIFGALTPMMQMMMQMMQQMMTPPVDAQ